MPTDDLFKFEPSTVSQEAFRPWKVLSVEDDPVYQASLVHALSCIKVARSTTGGHLHTVGP